MPDRTALVTGATDGVGRVVAKRLAAAGWRVIVHGRSRERGQGLASEIEANGGKAELQLADLAALDGVRDLATRVAATHERLDLLVNNAGIGFGGRGSGRELSPDGFELRLAVNYLAPFLLTRLLLPNLRAAAPARIVNVASIGQQDVDLDNLQLEHSYSGGLAYQRAKLALIMFTFDLADELAPSGVKATTLHPATYMDTFMVREGGARPLSTVDQGADAIMQLATDPSTAGLTGVYYNELHEARAREQAYDPIARAALRDQSFALTNAPR